MATLRGRGILVLALVSAGWAAVTLAPYPAVRVLVPAVFLAGILAMSRWPVLGATAVCLGQGLGLALGAPHVSAAGLVAGLGAMVLLGRRSRLPRALLPVLTAWGVIVATDLAPVRQVLGLALFAAAYGVGFTVRRAAERATAAEAALRELEAVEVAARARAELEDERHRLSARSTRLVAAATRQMRDLALAARPTLDTEDLARLRARGESAVDELRSLLGVLREDGTRAPALPAAEPVAPRRRPPWHADALTTVVLWGIALTVWLMERADAPPPLGAALAIGAVTLRRRAPAAALLIAAAGLVAQRFGGSPYQLGPALAVALALLVWSTVGARTPLRLAALVPLAAATLLVTEPAHDASLEVACAILLGAGLGSYAWHRLEEGHELARARSETYTRQVELAVAAAVGQERLAVARDLHDVASGAIGVMMLHASVAAVKRTADPVAARTALDDVA
ncbi:MAG: histidine kinase, partial [Actinomycetales bacterium]|nr:histidine kinase [Actinomycetales bacterium]